MNNIDFYNEENKVSGATFNFKSVGDEINGTLVGVGEKPDRFNIGKMQKIYEIMTTDGSINLVWGKPILTPQMKNVRIGQYLGIKFEAIKPNKDPNLNAAHILQVYAPQKADKSGPLMNEEWLKGQAEANLASGSATIQNESVATPPAGATPANDENFKEGANGEIKIEDVSFSDTKVAPVAPVAPVGAVDAEKEKIKELAMLKFSILDGNQALIKVMEATGLAVMPINYDAILTHLNAM